MKKLFSFLVLSALMLNMVPLALAFSVGAYYNTFDGLEGTNYYAAAVVRERISGLMDDYTAEAESTSTSDVIIGNTVNSFLYIGYDHEFDGFSIDIETPMTGGSYEVEYYDGSSWEFLTGGEGEIDNDGGAPLRHEWNRPAGWSQTTVDGKGPMYFVRIALTSDYAAVGRANQVGILEYNVRLELGDQNFHAFQGLDANTDIQFGDSGLGYNADGFIYGFKENTYVAGATYQTYYVALNADSTVGGDFDYSIRKAGYVTVEVEDVNVEPGFQLLVSQKAMQYSHRVRAENEAGDTIRVQYAVAGLDDVRCDSYETAYGSEAFCPVEVGDDNSDILIEVDGYVSDVFDIPNRTDATDPQELTVVELEYGYIAIIEDEDGDRVDDDIEVHAGNADVPCDNLGDGEYGCPIYIVDRDNDLVVEHEDGDVYYFEFDDDRDDHDDPQEVETFELDDDYSDRGRYDDDDDDDRDGLSNREEERYDTDPNDSDSDNDGVNDYYEVIMNTDPNDDDDFLVDYEDFIDYEDGDCDDPFVDTYYHNLAHSICALYEDGVVRGRGYNRYEPNAYMTRAEFLKVALLNADIYPYGNSYYSFNDVYSYDWYYSYVTYAAERGYVQGYGDGSFHPNDNITRDEAVVILMRIYDEEDFSFDSRDIDYWDVPSYAPYAYAVVIADEEGIMKGYPDGTFGVGKPITRAEVAAIARRAYYAFD